MPISAFFDWDGTLVNTIPMLFDAQNHVRTEMGLPLWSIEDFYVNLKHSSLELYPRIYGEESDKALGILYGFVEENHLNALEVYPGAEELVSFLHEAGALVGIVSNKKHKFLVREVEHLGWDKYVSAVIGAGQAEEDKPSAAPLMKALEQSAFAGDIQDVFYIGDTVTDMLVAENAGCRAILVTNGEDKDELIERFSPFSIVHGCEDLKTCLNDSIQHVVSKTKTCHQA